MAFPEDGEKISPIYCRVHLSKDLHRKWTLRNKNPGLCCLQGFQIMPTCCLHWSTFSELMSFTTTASGNPPNLSSFLWDLASYFRKAGLQKVLLLRACLHSWLDLDPVLRLADSTIHIARLGLLWDWSHSTSITNHPGCALGSDQHCARKPSGVLENHLSSTFGDILNRMFVHFLTQ